ncbi:MAG: phenylalanine--tRNA ligase subunit beta [Holosporales bacterium]|jgi:phenylalanyl-tRNA synthetase beta chain
MKISTTWVQRYLATLPQDFSNELTRLGLEFEGWDVDVNTLSPFTVAHIREAIPHPNASRLQVCTVDTAEGQKTIVCGASNARAGLKTVFAKLGTFIPGSGITIEKRPVRGVESDGMLCSAEELKLPWSTDGIIELHDDAVVGSPAAQALGLEGGVFSVGLTPNRADCFSVRGIARDLAAAGVGTFKDSPAPSFNYSASTDYPVIVNTDAVIGLALAEVSLPQGAKTPDFIAHSLRAVGVTLRSLAVDVTNFSCLGRGRPLHAFDKNKLKGALRFDLSKGGEALIALNGTTYTLPAGAIVISDDTGIIALAGIIGGASTAVGAQTTTILLESAVFDAGHIARAGQALGIVTDARQRFERGVDAQDMEAGLDEALGHLQSAGAGVKKPKIIRAVPSHKPAVIVFDPGLVATLGGLSVSSDVARKALEALGCTVTQKGAVFEVTSPSWRHDLKIAEDLVEEVLRLQGYAKIPSVSLPPVIPPVTVDFSQRLRTAFAAAGCVEVVSWSFAAPALVEASGEVDKVAALRLKNPISAELSVMRPNMVVSLLPLVAEAVRYGQASGKIFEIGEVFSGDGQGEARAIAVLWGDVVPRHWRGKKTAVDSVAAQALLHQVMASVGKPLESKVPDREELPPYLHPGQAGHYRHDAYKHVLATFGVLHPAILTAADIDVPIALAEVRLDTAEHWKPAASFYHSPYQAVRRDFAFIIPEKLDAAKVVAAVREASIDFSREVLVFDRFAGGDIPADHISLGVEVVLQAPDRTLDEATIKAVSEKIVAGVSLLGGRLRGNA